MSCAYSNGVTKVGPSQYCYRTHKQGLLDSLNAIHNVYVWNASQLWNNSMYKLVSKYAGSLDAHVIRKHNRLILNTLLMQPFEHTCLNRFFFE